jgi:hypothetical protein
VLYTCQVSNVKVKSKFRDILFIEVRISLNKIVGFIFIFLYFQTNNCFFTSRASHLGGLIFRISIVETSTFPNVYIEYIYHCNNNSMLDEIVT